MQHRRLGLFVLAMSSAIAQTTSSDGGGVVVGSGGGGRSITTGGGAPIGIRQFPDPASQANATPQSQQPPATLEGTVINSATGEPLKRATIMLMPMSPSTGGAFAPTTGMTSASGQFILNGVPPGTYRLSSERTGFVRSEYGSKGFGRPGTQFTLAPGQTLKDVTVKMQPHAVIAGRVLDEEGEPVANVQVQALTHRYMQGRKQLMPMTGSSTNDLGEYRMFGLAPGKYYLTATYRMGGMYSTSVERTTPGGPPQEEAYAPTYYPGRTDSAAAVPLQPEAGQTLTNVDIRLQRTRTVRVKGRVTGPATHGRTMVLLVQENDVAGFGAPRNVSQTQPDGSFEIRGVAAGAYQLIAQQSDQTGQHYARMPLDVGASNIENVELVVMPAVAVSGRIRMEGDAQQLAPGQVNVSLQPKERSPFGGGSGSEVKPDGTFTIGNIMPNTYRVNAFSRGQGMYVKAVYAGDQELPSREITVDGVAPILTVVVSNAAAQVSGQVKAEPASAGQGATVVLVPAAAAQRAVNDLYRTAITDQSGRFSLMNIPPGEYVAFAWDSVEPNAWNDPEFLTRFESKGQKLVLKEKESTTVDLDLIKVEDSQ